MEREKQRVRLVIIGRHDRDGEWEENRAECEATFYEKDGVIYLFYEEPDQGMGICKSRVEIRERSVTVDRKGSINAKLVYEMGKKRENTYASPYGIFLIDTDTRYFTYEKTPSGGKLRLEYLISMNGDEPGNATLEILFEHL